MRRSRLSRASTSIALIDRSVIVRYFFFYASSSSAADRCVRRESDRTSCRIEVGPGKRRLPTAPGSTGLARDFRSIDRSIDRRQRIDSGSSLRGFRLKIRTHAWNPMEFGLDSASDGSRTALYSDPEIIASRASDSFAGLRERLRLLGR
jgi:hypothetical protein